MTKKNAKGLYKPSFERDSCGFGLIANIDDKPSHWVVKTAISSLERLTHRGAISADGKSGDGCGLLIKFPSVFLRSVAIDSNINLDARFAAGSVFLNPKKKIANKVKKIIEATIKREGLDFAGWREVPINASVCGQSAMDTLPHIVQVYVNCSEEMSNETFNRKLFLARRRAETQFEGVDEFSYIASLSSDSISYKGMVMPNVLSRFYLDLMDDRLEASVCLFHQRFSTNTLPEWRCLLIMAKSILSKAIGIGL